MLYFERSIKNKRKTEILLKNFKIGFLNGAFFQIGKNLGR